MKKLVCGFEVSSRSYYFLLDWLDMNGREFIVKGYKKIRLFDLSRDEYTALWLHATTEEYNRLIKE